jgi:hypothetical protein
MWATQGIHTPSSRTELVTPPAAEPISLDEAKLHLRGPSDLDDDLVSALIGTARQMIETRLRRAIITQTWDLYVDAWPYGGGYYNRAIREQGPGTPGWLPTSGGVPILLPRPRLQSVTSIEYVDPGGNSQTLDPSEYDVSLGTPGRITPAYGRTWPSTRNQVDAVKVRFVAGYGDATAVPNCIKVGMKLLIGHLYENRGEEDVPMPSVVMHVIAPEDWGDYS